MVNWSGVKPKILSQILLVCVKYMISPVKTRADTDKNQANTKHRLALTDELSITYCDGEKVIL